MLTRQSAGEISTPCPIALNVDLDANEEGRFLPWWPGSASGPHPSAFFLSLPSEAPPFSWVLQPRW